MPTAGERSCKIRVRTELTFGLGNIKFIDTLDKSRLGGMMWGKAQQEWVQERMTGEKVEKPV